MAKKKMLKTAVRPPALKLLLVGVILLVLVDLLSKFNIIDITNLTSPVLIPLVASLFILIDLGIVQAVKRRKFKSLDVIEWVGGVIGLIGLIGVGLFALGLELQIFSTFQGILDIALLVYILIAIFKK